MYHSFLTHSFTDGHLSCFQHLAIVNCAAMNIEVHRFCWIGASGFLGYHPSSGIARSKYMSLKQLKFEVIKIIRKYCEGIEVYMNGQSLFSENQFQQTGVFEQSVSLYCRLLCCAPQWALYPYYILYFFPKSPCRGEGNEAQMGSAYKKGTEQKEWGWRVALSRPILPGVAWAMLVSAWVMLIDNTNDMKI